MPAYYQHTVSRFLSNCVSNIIGILTSKASNAGFYQQKHSQTDAWKHQIEILQSTFKEIETEIDVSDWHLLLEYPIPRRAKRIDAILLAKGLIIVFEFKCGAYNYTKDAIIQVEDYCLDLRDFHKPSENRNIIPILISTNACTETFETQPIIDSVREVIKANKDNLAPIIQEIINLYGNNNVINAIEWDNGDYIPTPTIIEAAQHLYAGKNVREISCCHRGVKNLTKTTDAVINSISEARINNQRMDD